jgi:spore germination protein KB
MAAEKIANRQLLFILFMMRTIFAIAFLPVLTTADALQDAWASAVISFFGAALLVAVIGGLGVRFPEQTVVQYSQKLLGRWAGKAVSLLPLGAFLFMAATDVRIYTEALTTLFLTETPLGFIIGTMVFAAALAAYAGIETIGRAADLFFPLFILMVFASLAMAVPQAWLLLHNLEPVLARGAGPVLRGAATPIAVISQYMVLTMLIPAVTEPKRALRTALGALVLSSALLLLITVFTVTVLGPHKGARSSYPFLSLVRSLQAGEFLERIEALAMFAWGFAHFVGLAVFLYCGARGLSQVLGLKSYRILIGPMAVIWVTLGVQGYRNEFQLRTLFQPGIAFPLAALGFILLPMSILWLGYGIRALVERFKPGGS